jgi:hypothetical protein
MSGLDAQQPDRSQENPQEKEIAPTASHSSPASSPLSALRHPDTEQEPREENSLALETGWDELVDVARHCPSPHNVQPWRIEPTGENTANLYIDGSRTFPWTDHTGSFILSSMKMFTTTLGMVAQNSGLKLNVAVEDVTEIDMQAPRSLFATLELEPSPGVTAHSFSNTDIQKRKTSRKPNLERPVPDEVIAEVREIVESHGYSLVTTDDQKLIDTVLRRDIRALFHDLNHREYFSELKPYLKLGAEENTRDGLHYKAMELPRWEYALMKYMPWSLNLPIFSGIAEGLYRRNLGHAQHMGFISGEFWEREDSLKAGEMMINMWMTLSKHDVHLHPFGNLVTNTDARADIEQAVGIEKMWFVFRFGYTDTPRKSQRLPLDELILPGEVS